MLTLVLLALALHAHPAPVRPAPILGAAYTETRATVTLTFGPGVQAGR